MLYWHILADADLAAGSAENMPVREHTSTDLKKNTDKNSQVLPQGLGTVAPLRLGFRLGLGLEHYGRFR